MRSRNINPKIMKNTKHKLPFIFNDEGSHEKVFEDARMAMFPLSTARSFDETFHDIGFRFTKQIFKL